MATNHADIDELMTELRTHYSSVREKTEFFRLKQSELRLGDEVSFFGFHQDRERLFQEHSLLAGHAHIVQEAIAQRKLVLGAADQRLLMDIAAFSRQQMSRY